MIIELIARLRRPASNWTALIICVVAFAVRLNIAATTIGTNDIAVWLRFSKMIVRLGVLPLYEIDRWFNHPPLMGYYGGAVLTLANTLHLDFNFVFKWVPILSNTVTIFLVHRLGRL
ncbi:MAG TPA: hypothetical protein VHZ95_18940, partial [Polyangiales bacterium]|nr:hypothetical protein [Polyangiales bacterium]